MSVPSLHTESTDSVIAQTINDGHDGLASVGVSDRVLQIQDYT